MLLSTNTNMWALTLLSHIIENTNEKSSKNWSDVLVRCHPCTLCRQSAVVLSSVLQLPPRAVREFAGDCWSRGEESLRWELKNIWVSLKVYSLTLSHHLERDWRGEERAVNLFLNGLTRRTPLHSLRVGNVKLTHPVESDSDPMNRITHQFWQSAVSR